MTPRWNKGCGIAALLDQIIMDYGQGDIKTPRLIEHTIEILGYLEAEFPEQHRSKLMFACSRVRLAWCDIERRWEAGAVDDIGSALNRRRPKSWNKMAYIKHYTKGPLVFAEINFLLSKGLTRSDAVATLASKYAASKSQIDAWYDKHAKELAAAITKGEAVPEALGDAFITVAKDQRVEKPMSASLKELRLAGDRALQRPVPKKNAKSLGRRPL
jgi:hypothetical protein